MRKRTPPINQESYAALNFPDGFSALGGGKSMPSYQKHLPELIDVAAYLWALLSEATYVYSGGVDKSLRKHTSHQLKDPGKFVSRLRPSTLFSCLVGRTSIRISHEPAEHKSKVRVRKTVDGIKCWVSGTEPNKKLHRSFVQILPFRIDSSTGEVIDRDALSYRDNARSLGYRCILYTLGRDSLAAFVDTSYMEYEAICKLSQELAKATGYVNASLNSLRMPISFLFSPCPHYGFNKIWDEGKRDLEVLEGLVVSDSEPAIYSDQEPQELLPNEREEKQVWEDPIVDKSERQLLLGLVEGNVSLLNVLGYLVLSPWRDGEYIVLDRTTMLLLLGKKDYKQEAISSTLESLSRFVPLSIKPYKMSGRATSVKLKSPFLFQNPIKNPVLLSSGSRALETIAKRDLAARNKAKEATTNYSNDMGKRLVEYLNSLPSNTFSAMIKRNMDETFLAASLLDEEAKTAAFRTLRKASVYPRPIYRVSKNSPRIYGIGSSLQYLNGSLRTVLFQDCMKLDLRHVQLSVAASLFGDSLTLGLLKDGDVWRTLENSTGLSKNIIKSAIYSSLFMPSLTIEAKNHPSKLPEETLILMLKNPYIRSFLKARERYIKNNFNDTKNDVFGNELKGDWNVRLAALIQGYEMLILEPALDYFLNLKDSNVKIVLWLHDGFYLSGSRRELIGISNNLCKIVQNTANGLGIFTGLEIDERSS